MNIELPYGEASSAAPQRSKQDYLRREDVGYGEHSRFPILDREFGGFAVPLVLRELDLALASHGYWNTSRKFFSTEETWTGH